MNVTRFTKMLKFAIIACLIMSIIMYIKLIRSTEQIVETEVEKCLREWKAIDNGPNEMNDDPLNCPKEPPKELLDAFSLNGTIVIEKQWKCQTGPAYHKEHKYTPEQFEEAIERVANRLTNYYGRTDTFLYEALDKYEIKNKSVAIMGSQRPTYESVCLVFGASNCTTIDFQPIITDYPKVSTMTVEEYDKNPIQFDAAISISSFEHDGLGRYGDPIKPDGDLITMKKMKCIIKEDGILYLSVPIGKDKIVWNMHRVYGQKRLPMLLEEWTLVEVIADYFMNERWSGCDARLEGDYEPIFVLQNRKPSPDHNLNILNQYLIENYKPGLCYGHY